MKGWKVFGVIVGIVLGLLAVGAGALAVFVSRLDVRSQVERAVENATGRDMTIAGDVGVSYWPVLGVRVGDITLANVEGGRAPALLRARQVDVGVELAPMVFRRRIVVQRLVLQEPRIALEVDAQGAPNWLLAPRAAPGAPAPRPTTPPSQPPMDVARTSLREIRIVDGEASFYDARRGAGWVIGDVDLSSALTSLDEPMRVEGEVRYNDRPVDIDARIARPGAAFRGQSTPLVLDLESELLTAHFNGQTVAASGEIAGNVRASGPSLRQLTAWMGAPLQGAVGFAQFAVAGRLQVGGGRYAFSNAGFALDLVRGRGDFVLSEMRGKPYLSGRLELFDFDLNPYLSGQAPPAPVGEAVTAPETAQTASQPTAEIAAVEAAPRAIDVRAPPSETPLDLAGLRAFNADLELITAAVLVQHMRIDRARLNLVLHDGYLAATLHDLSLYGGSGRGRFEIDAREPAATFVQDFAFNGLNAQRFLSDAFNFSLIEGRAEVAIKLRSRGRTQSELIAGSDGRAHIEVVSGVLHGVDLGGVATTIRNALRGELIAPEARTPFQGMSGTFSVGDGVLAADNLSFNTEDLRIPGLAVIDLPQRRLDARLAPRSPRGGIVFPFSVRGPWGQFVYAHDMGGRVQNELLARVRRVQAVSREN
jgi:AsmA protein